MKSSARSVLGGVVVGLAIASTAAAQPAVSVSPGQQSGSPGQEVIFEFGYEGNGGVVAGVGFDIVYPSDAPYVPVNEGGVVDCDIAEGANSDPDLVFFDPARNLFAISFGDFSNPIQPIGQSGVIERCRVQIKEDAALGTYPLQCGEVASANDANGNELTIECTDGELVIEALPPPTDTPKPPTPTNTPEPTNTRPPGGGDEDDGCQIVAPAGSNAAWLLVPPALLLLGLGLRRRAR